MSTWKDICHVDEIVPNSGRCALYEGQQVAIFRISHSGSDSFYALQNSDPLSGANVISRGIVGSKGDLPVVASPLYKQHFCLSSGQCLQDEVRLKTWRVLVRNDRLLLAN